MYTWNSAARVVVATLRAVAIVAVVSGSWMAAARADDKDKTGSNSATTSSGGTGSGSSDSAAASGTGSSQANPSHRMTPSAVGKMSPAQQMKMMDKDNKGYVTKEEFMRFQEQLWNNVSKSSSDRITEQEWLNQIHSGP